MCGAEITYPFPNFNGRTVEAWEWISNFIPHFTGMPLFVTRIDTIGRGKWCTFFKKF